MRILAFDTSGPVLSAAVAVEGQLRSELSVRAPKGHGAEVLRHLEHVLQMSDVNKADIECLAVGLGPGSFTGLRVGLATAKGLAVASGVPLVAMGSLELLARGVARPGALVVAVSDAHKAEVYAAAYRLEPEAGLKEVQPPLHVSPTRLGESLSAVAEGGPLVLCGDGVRQYERELRASLGDRAELASTAHDTPRAAYLALAAAGRQAAQLSTLEPLYVRASDARLPDIPLPG